MPTLFFLLKDFRIHPQGRKTFHKNNYRKTILVVFNYSRFKLSASSNPKTNVQQIVKKNTLLSYYWGNVCITPSHVNYTNKIPLRLKKCKILIWFWEHMFGLCQLKSKKSIDIFFYLFAQLVKYLIRFIYISYYIGRQDHFFPHQFKKNHIFL